MIYTYKLQNADNYNIRQVMETINEYGLSKFLHQVIPFAYDTCSTSATFVFQFEQDEYDDYRATVMVFEKNEQYARLKTKSYAEFVKTFRSKMKYEFGYHYLDNVICCSTCRNLYPGIGPAADYLVKNGHCENCNEVEK